ncbi:hypothetical protein RhiJN_05893 [Ceratobasidium sp. AG-Ba]|nr:hypothetical protein RhiJN_05893 [Ceratobasidium sp. AG-Ba]QRW06822.1 hypothetical protein RhiLY_05821 [Ceratobasidium sp. AG-Ba]
MCNSAAAVNIATWNDDMWNVFCARYEPPGKQQNDKSNSQSPNPKVIKPAIKAYQTFIEEPPNGSTSAYSLAPPA